MVYIDAEKARKLSAWSKLPEEYKKDIELATDYGLNYVKVRSDLMDENIQYALQELGFYIYQHRLTKEYEIRW